MAVGLLTNPGPFLVLSNGIAGLITDQVAPDDEPTSLPAEKKTEDKKKTKKNKQPQR